MSFSDTDLLPPSHFQVPAQPENDNICIVLLGKGRGSQAKEPKSSPSGTHSGQSSVAHLLYLVSTLKKKADEEEKKKKKETLGFFFVCLLFVCFGR